MKKQLLPAVTTVDAATFEEFTASANVVVMGFFAKPDSDAAEAFAATASKYRDDYIFGMTTDATLAKKAGAAVPGVVLFKKFDEKKNVFDGATVNAEDLENFIQTYSVPLVDDIGPINYSKYMDSGLPLAYAFVASDEDRELFGETLNALAKEYRGKVNFCYIDVGTGRRECALERCRNRLVFFPPLT